MALSPGEAARAYYRAIDEGAYDDLSRLLAPGFVHERPDRTLEGRDRFVRFMREERSVTDTDHVIDAVYRAESEVAVRGRLHQGTTRLLDFVDVFTFTDGGIARVETYTQ